MRTDEMLTAIRLSANIEDAADDWGDAAILLQASKAQTAMFERAVVNAREGYWRKRVIVSTASGTQKYRIPHRACVQGLERVEIADSSGLYRELHEVTLRQAMEYDVPSGWVGRPQVCAVDGDGLRLYPCPDAVYTLRFHYYVRPARLTTQQASTLGSGTVRGLITAVNTTTRVIAVNVIPHDMLDVSPAAAITSGSQLIDVVKPNGWYEPVLVGAAQTYSGLNITVGGSDDMSEIAVGDFVRSADQTDWPQLPVDFHESLCLATAARIARKRGHYQKAGALDSDLAGDASRFTSLIAPRIKDSAKRVIPTGGPIRRRFVA